MANIIFLEYPKCSTCKKAKKYLDEKGVQYIDRNIVKDNPSAAELEKWHKRSGLPVKRFFNTSGMLYRELKIKEKFETGLSDAEAYELLSTNGMLVKRPLLITDSEAIPGFKEPQWDECLK